MLTKKTPEQKQAIKAEFWFNIRTMPKMLSAWVTAVVSLAAAYWLQLSPADQQALISEYPILIKASPVISMLAWMYARAKPQGNPSVAFQETQAPESPTSDLSNGS